MEGPVRDGIEQRTGEQRKDGHGGYDHPGARVATAAVSPVSWWRTRSPSTSIGPGCWAAEIRPRGTGNGPIEQTSEQRKPVRGGERLVGPTRGSPRSTRLRSASARNRSGGGTVASSTAPTSRSVAASLETAFGRRPQGRSLGWPLSVGDSGCGRGDMGEAVERHRLGVAETRIGAPRTCPATIPLCRRPGWSWGPGHRKDKPLPSSRVTATPADLLEVDPPVLRCP